MHRGVDRDPLKVPGPQRSTFVGDPQALSQQPLQLVAQPLAPVAQIRACGNSCWKNSSTRRSLLTRWFRPGTCRAGVLHATGAERRAKGPLRIVAPTLALFRLHFPALHRR
jgi:hypothetical protein